ncbi:MAG: hypothetical protein NT178_14305 [Proteobacteria bacterium]|nr:hypothetical protein [Pseudomonadota bacterium]
MITGINSFYYSGIVNSVILSEKSQHTPQNVNNSRPDDSRKVRLSDEKNSIRPFAPEADIKISLSGSVIYDPNSLLADLSGIGRSQKIKQEMPKTIFPYGSSQPLREFQLIFNEPVTHTFEIIV